MELIERFWVSVFDNPVGLIGVLFVLILFEGIIWRCYTGGLEKRIKKLEQNAGNDNV